MLFLFPNLVHFAMPVSWFFQAPGQSCGGALRGCGCLWRGTGRWPAGRARRATPKPPPAAALNRISQLLILFKAPTLPTSPTQPPSASRSCSARRCGSTQRSVSFDRALQVPACQSGRSVAVAVGVTDTVTGSQSCAFRARYWGNGGMAPDCRNRALRAAQPLCNLNPTRSPTARIKSRESVISRLSLGRPGFVPVEQEEQENSKQATATTFLPFPPPA